MTIVIKHPGKYDLSDNSYGNLDIRASNVTFNGNDHTLFGYIHIGNEYHRVTNVKINNLIIKPHSNICSKTDELCPICNARIFDPINVTTKKSEALIYIHGNNIEINSCPLHPNKELDSYITISHSTNIIINNLPILDVKGKSICYVKIDD